MEATIYERISGFACVSFYKIIRPVCLVSRQRHIKHVASQPKQKKQWTLSSSLSTFIIPMASNCLLFVPREGSRPDRKFHLSAANLQLPAQIHCRQNIDHMDCPDSHNRPKFQYKPEAFVLWRQMLEKE